MLETQTRSFIKPLIFLVVLLIIILGLLFWFIPSLRSKLPFTQKQPAVQRQVINTAELPNGFPVNLPLLKASVVVHNFEVMGDDGVKQSVRKWQSTETVTHAKAAYTEYFAKNGWEIVTNVDQPTVQLLGAKRDKQFMSVSIHSSPSGSGSLIEVTVR